MALAAISLTIGGCALPLPNLPRTTIPDWIKAEVHELPGTRMASPTVFLNADLPTLGASTIARYGEDRIEIRPIDNEAKRHFVLAHEYVHVTVRPKWRTLPHVVEEGLANRVATRVSPDFGERWKALISNDLQNGLRRHPSPDIVPSEWTEIDGNQLERLPRHQQEALAGLGQLLAWEITESDLFAMANRAIAEGKRKIPAKWLLAKVAPGLLGRNLNSESIESDTYMILKAWMRANPLFPPASRVPATDALSSE